MARLPGSPAPQVKDIPAHTPLSVLRTETVLSRFPMHNLSKRGRVTIHIVQTNAQGEVDLRWAVSSNDLYGPPGPLAYKLDTIVLNQIFDALPRPLPRVIKVGSLRQTCHRLGFAASGKQLVYVKTAFHQNASAYIVTKLRYQGRDGTVRRLETGFTRYSVLFTGERLLDGTTADAMYLVLSDPYQEVLNHAPVRPLDYAYLKALTPTAQRFYEMLSYRMFAACTYRHPHATLRYADYCLLSTQHRSTDAVHVQKHMYKVHRPHLQSGYFSRVQYAATTDADGQPDWLLHYTPGPKARTEYAAFRRRAGTDAAALVLPADADQEDLVATRIRALPEVTPPPGPETRRPPVAAPDHQVAARPTVLAAALPAMPCPPSHEDRTTVLADPMQVQAHALVRQFYQRFHGLAQVTPHPKELAHATELLAQYGAAKAHSLVDFSHQAARETQYHPQTFMGILHYLSRALAAYDTRATQATTRQAEAATRRWQERYEQWRQEAVARLRAALPAEDLAALEAESRARLIADGAPAYTLTLAVRAAVEAAIEVRAGLPSFEVWQQTQEACG